MAVIKCKMCGGDLNIVEGESVCECEYCGTRQTIPSADNEKKLALFVRANRLRLTSEFDKASGIYENIVAEFPEEAEAYWGLVLCKYGIEYVDDPATGKKVPTCHRSSFKSVMEDEDFEQVMENSDPVARKVYREEAKQIEEIRKGILEVSGKEEPYDIFICYKETDENGDRTLDSVLAQDLYNALIDKGYRVFFSRITLEDKLGQEYEPYIFAGLNSAKVMLAVGTDYEYYNAVWVKNEWSRYLKLMAKDKDKHLIPCYKNLDAYDIPKEFTRLQAQDLGKVGATQDLLRGIEKLLGGGAAVGDMKLEQQTVIVKAEAPGVESLLKRADMFLEDGEWDNAKEYYNRVLDIAPECAKAYLGLSLAAYQFVNMGQVIGERKQDFFASKNLEKAERFADETLKAEIFEMKSILENRIAEDKEAKKKAAEDRKKQEERRREENIKRLLPLRQKLKPVTNRFISTEAYHTAGLRSDGTVLTTVYTGESEHNRGQCNVAAWKDMVSVSTGIVHTVGLRRDGTVTAVGLNDDGRCDVTDWKSIIEVSAGLWHTVGLRSDGTVVATGDNENGECNVSKWQNIVSVSAGSYHTVGLRSDGTVAATEYTGDSEYDEGQCAVQSWTDIVAVSAGHLHTVGLLSDGTVVAVGLNAQGQCNVSGWQSIVSISAGWGHTVGLRSDGTVVAVGYDQDGRCNVSEWTDIVAVSAGWAHTVGIKSDGTVLSTKYLGNAQNDFGQCAVDGWKLFDSLETLEQEYQACRDRKHREEELRIQREKERVRQITQQRELEFERRSQGLCPYCGGIFKGLFKKVCTQCGKPKDY